MHSKTEHIVEMLNMHDGKGGNAELKIIIAPKEANAVVVGTHLTLKQQLTRIDKANSQCCISQGCCRYFCSFASKREDGMD